MRIWSPLPVVIVIGAILAVSACQPAETGLQATDAAYRAPLGASNVGVAYVTLRSLKADRIVAVSSPEAQAVEMHETVVQGDRSRMQRVDSLDLPAGTEVRFTAGGLHLMVISPQPPSSAGADATFPIQFKLESGETKTVRFAVGTGGQQQE